MELYRSIDIDAITSQLDNIVEKATYKKMTTQEPTIFKCNKIKDDIVTFIKKKKRIIYGGTAYHHLIQDKNKEDGIYNDMSCKDVEFYSPVPFEDIAELCDHLNTKYDYVTATEAAHNETFTVFVNFNAFCDITYMPGPIYYKMPKKVMNGLYYSHPSFILVDILRQYNDPLNSYWRLKDKTYFRANKLLTYYPLELMTGKYTNAMSIANQEVIKELFARIQSIPTLVHLSNSYYLDPEATRLVCSDTLVVMTDKLDQDTKRIHDIVLDIVLEKDKVSLENYHPFFQFWDKRNIIKCDKEPVIVILGHNNMCLPYHVIPLENKTKEKSKTTTASKMNVKDITNTIKYNELDSSDTIKVGTFMLVLNYHLIQLHYYYIYEMSDIYKRTQILMYSLLKSRADYLKKHNATVIDKTPYQEFIIECYGKGVDILYESRLRVAEKKKRGLQYRYFYDPKAERKQPVYKFQNSSGRIMNNGT
jgi:hypothetical protein